MNSPLVSVWCALPWYSFDDQSSQGYRPCPYHETLYSSPDLSLESRWRSRESGNLRYEFLKGQTPQGCHRCKMSEEATGESPRLREHKKLGLSLQINTMTITGLRAPQALSIRLHDESEERIIPDHWLQELSHLTFYGAEPFSNKLFTDTVSRMVQIGDANHVSLSLSTDLSSDPLSVLKTLAQFGNLSVQLNILDVDSRLEFLFPSTSRTFNERLHSLRDFTTPGSVSVVLRLNVLNIFYVTEILEKFRTDFPDFLIQFDTDSADPAFHVKNLPPKAKSEIGHLLKFIDGSKFNFSSTNSPRSLIESLGANGDPSKLDKTIEQILKDLGRTPEEFRSTFTKLWPFLKLQPEEG